MMQLYQFPHRVSVWFFCLTVVALTGCGLNDIPDREKEVKTAWDNLVMQYKMRSDLLPNLVNTIRNVFHGNNDLIEKLEAASLQSGTMENPEELFSNPVSFKTFQLKQAEISRILSSLMGGFSEDSVLMDDQNLQALKAQLTLIENRIAVARRDYEAAVDKYNVELGSVSGRLWKSILYRDAKPVEGLMESSTLIPEPS